jgi:hypothetical protein
MIGEPKRGSRDELAWKDDRQQGGHDAAASSGNLLSDEVSWQDQKGPHQNRPEGPYNIHCVHGGMAQADYVRCDRYAPAIKWSKMYRCAVGEVG